MAIAFLVFSVLILMSFTWYSFLVEDGEVRTQIESASIMERLYARESEINFILYRIAERAAGGDAENDDIVVSFAEGFKEGLGAYKDGEEYLISEFDAIEKQLHPNQVVVEDGKIGINLNIKIVERVGVEDFDLVKASYIYEKRFEGLLE